jgi:hypothetical protein
MQSVEKVCKPISTRKSIFLFALVLLFFSSAIGAIGLGVSPAKIKFESVLRNGYAEKTVTVSNPNEEQMVYSPSAEGSFKEWFSFKSADNFTMPPKSTSELKIMIRPPNDAANGIYNGTITVRVAPAVQISSGMGMSVAAGIAVLTSVEIAGTQIKKARVEKIAVSDVEEGQPVTILIALANEGNVVVKPLIQATVFDQSGKQVKRLSFSETEVFPTRSQNIEANFSSEGMQPQQYSADVSVFLDETKETPLIQQNLSFNVLNEGMLAKKGVLRSIKSPAWVNASTIVKIEPIFENIGEARLLAKFKGEVYLDEILVKLLESEETEVLVGETKTLAVYFTPEEAGRYVIRGKVFYSGKVTEEKEAVINALPLKTALGETSVTGRTAFAQTNYLTLAAITAILAIFAVLRLYYIKRK